MLVTNILPLINQNIRPAVMCGQENGGLPSSLPINMSQINQSSLNKNIHKFLIEGGHGLLFKNDCKRKNNLQ